MLGFDVRHVVPSSTGRRVLFGAFEHTVAVHDLVRGTLSREFETIFDFGGQRLALSDEVDGVLAAAYHVHGLAFYSCGTGYELWRRKDIKKVQQITLSRDGLTANCGREGASLVVIDLRSGETVGTFRGTQALYDSKYDDVRFLDGTRPRLLDGTGKHTLIIDRTTFAFLDVAFAPGFLVASESGGPVRCFDIATGTERWRYRPQTGSHVLYLGYRESEPEFLGIEWPFQKGGSKRALRWSLKSGAVTESLDLGSPTECCFALAGEVIVTSEGSVLDTTTGASRAWSTN